MARAPERVFSSVIESIKCGSGDTGSGRGCTSWDCGGVSEELLATGDVSSGCFGGVVVVVEARAVSAFTSSRSATVEVAIGDSKDFESPNFKAPRLPSILYKF